MSLPKRTPARLGYTLFEMLMVQALLVAMVAASWPMLRAPFGKNQLLDAARQVRVELIKARHEAIETGVAHQLRFQPGTGTFEISPVSSETPSKSVHKALDRSAARGRTESAARDSRDAVVAERRLPADVRFIGPEMSDAADAPDDRHATDGSQRSEDATAQADEDSWSSPIYFYPNGRTSDAVIRMEGKRDYEVAVALRGLTGIATIEGPQRTHETR